MANRKIYLAGPEIFFPEADTIGSIHKKICKANGFEGLYPLNNAIKGKTPEVTAKAIVEANIKTIQACDYVIANLSNFRGTIENPACDSGTAWECGYALALNKKVIAYTDNVNSIPKGIINNIDLTVYNISFNEIFTYLNTVIFKHLHNPITQAILPLFFNLDPKSPDIQDANAESAFFLGYRYGNGLSCSATLTDYRTQIEKYGTTDQNGNKVENFGHCVNIMISCNTKIISSTNNDIF